MRRSTLTLLGGAVLALGPASAFAQVEPDAMVRGRQPRTMKIEVSGRVEYDNNIARTSEAAAAMRNVEPQDTTYSPSVSVDVIQPLGRQAIFLRGNAGYIFHDKNKQLDDSRVNLTGGVGGSVGPCGAVLSGGLFRGRSLLGEPSLITDATNITKVRSVNVGATCVTPTGIGVIASAGRDWTDNTLSQASLSDSRTTNATVGLSYARGSLGRLSLMAGYTENKTPSRPGAAFFTDGYERQTIGLSYERKLGARIQATASVSYYNVDISTLPGPPPPGSPPDASTGGHGIGYQASVEYRASSRLGFRATAERSASPTLLAGSAYEIRQGFTVGADYQLGARIQLSVAGRLYDTSTPQGVAAVATLTDARATGITAGVTYKMSKHLSFSIDAAHDKQTANLPDAEYTSDRIAVVVRSNF